MANDLVVTVQEEDLLSVSTNLNNPIGSISEIADVDTSVLENGSVLVYKIVTSKWTSTRLLDLQVMEGGEF